MKDLLVIIIYFSDKWPPWFPLFLKSCEKNSWVDWKIFTNIAPISAPDNVSFIDFSLDSFKKLAEEKIGVTPTFTDPYKICDFRITFGVMFEEYLKDYKYWGHGDIDVIYGNLGKFLAPIISYEYDIISLAYNRLTGHLGLLKNVPEVINKYQLLENFKGLLEDPYMKWVSEYSFSNLFKRRECFFQDLDPFDRFMYKKNSNFIFIEGLWDNGTLYVKDEEKKIEVPIYHFYLYLGRYRREASWRRFKKLVHISPEEKKWRITSIGILK